MTEIIGNYPLETTHRGKCQHFGLYYLGLRHQYGLRLKDIAKRTGVSITAIDNFELGSGDLDVFFNLYLFFKKFPEMEEEWRLKIPK